MGSQIVIRLGKDTRVKIGNDGKVSIEQGPYIDTDPDHQREWIELSKDEMRQLFTVWLGVITI